MAQIETPEQQIERLSAQVAQLQARLETAPPSTPGVSEPTKASLRLRAFFAALLIAVGVILAPVAVVAAWTKTEVTDTGRFVATLSPLVDDPAFQAFLVDQITTVIDDQVDFEAIATDLFDGIAQLNLPPRAQTALGLLKQPAIEGARSLVRTATQRLIASDAFANIWEQSLRVSHSQVIAALQGDTGGPLTIGAQGEVGIQLAPLIAAVKSALVAQGFALADRIPEINRTIQVAQSAALVQARVAYQLLDVLGFVLPWVSLVLLAAGVVVARRKARALIWAGLLLALSMAVLATGISVGRILFAGSVSPQYLPRDAALATYDAIVPFISATALAVGTAGVTVAVVAYLAGPFRGAIVVRRLTVDSARSIRSSAERRGGTTGAFGVWLYSVRRYARVVVALVAGAVVLFVRPLSPGVIIGTAVTALVAILLIELLQRPPADGVAASL
ncbi:hypothetical protein QN355_10505 [Cryobacterium sp. 10S3]|uniref:hypothetical protein n=1 Tax=Cryobacterium sp. 10S3 TaxID=3048582 RepID=UPI002AC924B9|nr:hypothetical protein [Cryobacterium sp. 10S3]MEB0286982.1 hypothetical protein [Cryobacterium sp. 10S3]WPX15573.1 hypothetical protein RHM57_09595 [Cryobacterium sp. 10S3]